MRYRGVVGFVSVRSVHSHARSRRLSWLRECTSNDQHDPRAREWTERKLTYPNRVYTVYSLWSSAGSFPFGCVLSIPEPLADTLAVHYREPCGSGVVGLVIVRSVNSLAPCDTSGRFACAQQARVFNVESSEYILKQRLHVQLLPSSPPVVFLFDSWVSSGGCSGAFPCAQGFVLPMHHEVLRRSPCASFGCIRSIAVGRRVVMFVWVQSRAFCGSFVFGRRPYIPVRLVSGRVRFPCTHSREAWGPFGCFGCFFAGGCRFGYRT